MTKKKKADENEKHINETAHQRAMTNPKVRETLMGLRACWSLLTKRQRGEQLNELIGLACSVRGIAKELGKPETTIRNFIKLAKQPEEDSDGIAMRERTCAEIPKEPSTMSAGEAARHLPPKIPVEKKVAAAIKEASPAQDYAHTSTAQQTKKIASPLSTMVKEAPVVNSAMSRQEGQVGKGTPKTNSVVSYGWPFTEERKRRLEAIIEEPIPPRPIYTANSMRRQGPLVPPKDPHKPVS